MDSRKPCAAHASRAAGRIHPGESQGQRRGCRSEHRPPASLYRTAISSSEETGQPEELIMRTTVGLQRIVAPTPETVDSALLEQMLPRPPSRRPTYPARSR